MNQLKNLELAWAAGFYDGEGSTCGSNNKDGGRSLSLNISQVDIRPLKRFKHAIGGKQKIYKTKKGKNNSIHVYREYGEKAYHSIDLLWPYLSHPKKEQALSAFLSISLKLLKKPNANKKQLYCLRGHKFSEVGISIKKDGGRQCAECKRLKARGVKLPPIEYKLSPPNYIKIREYDPVLGEKPWSLLKREES